MLLDTTPNATAAPPLAHASGTSAMRVSYFEERTSSKDQFDAIIGCIKQRGGASRCSQLAQPWL